MASKFITSHMSIKSILLHQPQHSVHKGIRFIRKRVLCICSILVCYVMLDRFTVGFLADLKLHGSTHAPPVVGPHCWVDIFLKFNLRNSHTIDQKPPSPQASCKRGLTIILTTSINHLWWKSDCTGYHQNYT
jgi:hypothetical protein